MLFVNQLLLDIGIKNATHVHSFFITLSGYSLEDRFVKRQNNWGVWDGGFLLKIF